MASAQIVPITLLRHDGRTYIEVPGLIEVLTRNAESAVRVNPPPERIPTGMAGVLRSLDQTMTRRSDGDTAQDFWRIEEKP